jgi:hypothetical protein
MLYAASEQSQSVYALVEGRYQDVGALPGHPATFRWAGQQQPGFLYACRLARLHAI